MINTQRYFIGIDCGVHTGFALWDSKDRLLLELSEYKLHEAIFRVKELYLLYGDALCVRVEDARQRKWYGRTHEQTRAKLQGAGSIKRDCQIWEEFLTDLGVEFRMLHPIKGGTKWDAERFKMVTGYKGQTNEHKRDAGCLVVGL